MPKVINRATFFAKVKRKPFNNRLSASQKQGLDYILDVWEANFVQRTPITQLSYCLGTACWETAHTMQPIKERGGNAYFFKYDPRGPKPKLAAQLGNTQPGDGVKFPGMGLVQSTGRGNARKATKRLRELGIIDSTIDFEKTPEKLMIPRIAAAVLFIGMEEGWFTGRNLDKIIDAEVDGDEHSDFVKARSIINGTDKANAIADLADAFLEALVMATSESDLSEEDVAIIKNKDITKALSADDLDDDELDIPVAASKKINLNKFETKGVQARLYSMGYKMVGKADGKFGKNTAAAIAALEKQAGLPITGGYNEDVKAAMANDKNKYQVAPARANATVATVRASGSQTIKATDAIKTTSTVTGLGLVATSAGSAVVQYGSDAWTWVKTARETFDFIPLWVWPLLGLFVVYVLWKQGQKVETTRVEDERSGKNVGEPVSLDDDPDELDTVDPQSATVPKFLTEPKEGA